MNLKEIKRIERSNINIVEKAEKRSKEGLRKMCENNKKSVRKLRRILGC